MKVKDLIEFLKHIENKELPVFLFHMQEILPLEEHMFDLDITDRIDINLP
jgi:hypothetical protein